MKTSNVIELLEEKRLELKETISVFVKRLEMKSSFYSNMKSGRRSLPKRCFHLVASLLGIDEERLRVLIQQDSLIPDELTCTDLNYLISMIKASGHKSLPVTTLLDFVELKRKHNL